MCLQEWVGAHTVPEVPWMRTVGEKAAVSGGLPPPPPHMERQEEERWWLCLVMEEAVRV